MVYKSTTVPLRPKVPETANKKSYFASCQSNATMGVLFRWSEVTDVANGIYWLRQWIRRRGCYSHLGLVIKSLSIVTSKKILCKSSVAELWKSVYICWNCDQKSSESYRFWDAVYIQTVGTFYCIVSRESAKTARQLTATVSSGYLPRAYNSAWQLTVHVCNIVATASSFKMYV